MKEHHMSLRGGLAAALAGACLLAGAVLSGPPGLSLTAAGASGAGAPVSEGAGAVPAGLAEGALVFNPVSGRNETFYPKPAQLAVVIGDSQAAGAAGVLSRATWPLLAVSSLGYTPVFRGLGGTGYVAANQQMGNYLAALRGEQWLLPHGAVGLVVIEGGGNDARTGATDAQIRANAGALVTELRKSYPTSPLVMVGTLARSADDGGGRRHEVDALLRSVAAENGVSFVSAGDWLSTKSLAGQLADGVHLTAAGHRAAAAVLAGELRGRGYGRLTGLPLAQDRTVPGSGN